MHKIATKKRAREIETNASTSCETNQFVVKNCVFRTIINKNYTKDVAFRMVAELIHMET